MSHSIVRESHHSLSAPSVGWSSALVGATLVALTKAADIATTLVGLDAGLSEMNPVARAAMAELGVAPGLVVMGVVSVAAIVGLIEGASAVCRRIDATAKYVPWIRVSWYLLAVATNAIVAGHNAALIGGLV